MFDKLLPFDFETKDDDTYYWGCTFKENCGPFKKGERIGLLKLDYNLAMLYEVDGDVLRDIKLKITASL